MFGIEQTRCSSAEVDCIDYCIREARRQADATALVKCSMLPDFCTNGLHIRRKSRRRHHACVEVAVRALRLTKGNLYVNSDANHLSQNSSTPALPNTAGLV